MWADQRPQTGDSEEEDLDETVKLSPLIPLLPQTSTTGVDLHILITEVLSAISPHLVYLDGLQVCNVFHPDELSSSFSSNEFQTGAPLPKTHFST